MEVFDLEGISPSPPLELTSEQKVVLDDLCLYHQKGVGLNNVTVRSWRLVVFFACCFAIFGGLVIFANRIPPFVSTLLCGYFAGSLVTATRYRLAFQRQWPLLAALIDWKLAHRMRRDANMLDDHVA